MTKDQARAAITQAWRDLPEDKRRTEGQAAAFALRAMQRYQFGCLGSRYQLIKYWLVQGHAG